MSVSKRATQPALNPSDPDPRPDLMPKGEGLDTFTFGSFRFLFRALDELSVPAYPGALFRGGFGKAMRETSCLPDWSRPCARCILNGDCAYSYLFETPNTLRNEFLDGVSHAPHPFVLRPPLSRQTSYRAGETFEVGMVLIGKALRLVPRVIVAFEHFGTRGVGEGRRKFRLESVSAYHDRKWKQVYSSDEGVLSDTSFTVTARDIVEREGPPEVAEIDMEIVTPLRLKSGGSLSDTLTFTSLLTGLLRRTYLLDHWHCSGKLGFDHKSLIEISNRVENRSQDLRWVDWERYSFRQRTSLKMGGLVGSVGFRGPLTTFVPYLRLGEAVHIGKGTAFGLGMFSVKSCR